jgi:2'-5' RNA ligase
VRQFLALDLSAEVRERAAVLLARLEASLSGWRFVRAEGLHVTLRFLGEVGDEADRSGRDLWRAAARAAVPFELRIGGLGTFPEGRRARVLWVGAEELGHAASLESVAAMLEDAARTLGLRPETRPFHAHLTLARATERPDPVPPRERDTFLGNLDVRELVLFRSRLARGGARYERIDAFPLGPDAAGSAIVPRGREP